jgi:hypothetical protein
LDNKKAIDEFAGSGLEELKQQTLVEQHDDPNKMHIYFIVEREIPNKASDKVDISKAEKIKANEIPALEVKSNSKGIMFCSTSPHADGSNYQIIGTRKLQVFNAQDVENRIGGICDKYGIPLDLIVIMAIIMAIILVLLSKNYLLLKLRFLKVTIGI